MFGRLGWMEILIIVVLVVVLFGHSKIPGMMKNLADGINIFKKELKDTKTPESKPVAADAPAQPAVKPTTKKVAAKKPTTKKTATKSATAKKTVAKKSPAKKSVKK